MSKLLYIFFFFYISLTEAKDNTGIKFEHGLTWSQIKKKAKQQNKYIFIDMYTTWCAPCRRMTQEIFSQSNVGTFFNLNFINVAVQLDVTKKDDIETKSWYKDAKALNETYKIRVFPTYLFFNPEGELVHSLEGATFNPDEFISEAKNALNSTTQYTTLKQQFEKGKRDISFLMRLTKAAQQTNDNKFIPVVANAYLATQDNLLTTDNLKLILLATTKSTDRGFKILRDNGIKVDSVVGKGKSSEKVRTIVFDEIMLPYLAIKASKNDFGGGMVMYSGDIIKNVNWQAAKAELNSKYPDLTEAILIYAKPFYYQWIQNWPKLTESVSDYLSSSYADNLSNDLLNSYAMNIFHSSDDIHCLETALGWSEKTLSRGNEKNIDYLFSYSNLLYKLGRNEQAITSMQTVVTLSGKNEGVLVETLIKMKNGKKTW